ncbi:MAG: hypothetical protein SVY53_03120, partial [Chloroflexota bacterium]|nr:hypothetical protein [Chloroflexota bacterium]
NTLKRIGSVEIPSEGSIIWISEDTAQGQVIFPKGPWMGQLIFKEVPAAESILVQIGTSTNGSDFHFPANGPQAVIGTGCECERILTFETNPEQIIVPEGHYLALKIANNGCSTITLSTGGPRCYITNPDTGAPVWPIPELPTITLLTIGLIGLVSYSWFRTSRRRKAADSVS